MSVNEILLRLCVFNLVGYIFVELLLARCLSLLVLHVWMRISHTNDFVFLSLSLIFHLSSFMIFFIYISLLLPLSHTHLYPSCPCCPHCVLEVKTSLLSFSALLARKPRPERTQWLAWRPDTIPLSMGKPPAVPCGSVRGHLNPYTHIRLVKLDGKRRETLLQGLRRKRKIIAITTG